MVRDQLMFKEKNKQNVTPNLQNLKFTSAFCLSQACLPTVLASPTTSLINAIKMFNNTIAVINENAIAKTATVGLPNASLTLPKLPVY